MWVFVYMLMIAGALEGQKGATNALELNWAGGCEPPDVVAGTELSSLERTVHRLDH